MWLLIIQNKKIEQNGYTKKSQNYQYMLKLSLDFCWISIEKKYFNRKKKMDNFKLKSWRRKQFLKIFDNFLSFPFPWEIKESHKMFSS